MLHYTETIQLSCNANQLTGFYISVILGWYNSKRFNHHFEIKMFVKFASLHRFLTILFIHSFLYSFLDFAILKSCLRHWKFVCSFQVIRVKLLVIYIQVKTYEVTSNLPKWQSSGWNNYKVSIVWAIFYKPTRIFL